MTDLTLRLVYDPAVVMAGALCLRETTPHEPCTQPWGHDGDCGDLDAAIRHHPAGKDHTPPRVPEYLRIDDIQDYLRQKGEIS